MNNKHVAILVVCAVVLAGGSFYAGSAHAKSAVAAQRSAMAAQGGMRGGGQFGGAGAGRGGGMMGGFTAGEILTNDGQTMTVKLQNGGSKIVLLGDTTTVAKSVAGTPADLVVGADVMVTGKANSDGSVTASAVQIRPKGMMPMVQTPGGAQPKAQ